MTIEFKKEPCVCCKCGKRTHGWNPRWTRCEDCAGLCRVRGCARRSTKGRAVCSRHRTAPRAKKPARMTVNTVNTVKAVNAQPIHNEKRD